MKQIDRQELRRRIELIRTKGQEGSSADFLDAGDALDELLGDLSLGDVVLSLLDNVDSLEGLYRMHQETETREMLDLKAERAVLLDQIAALQSEANSWQSGYDVGRVMGGKHRATEVEQLTARVESLQKDADRFRWLSRRIAISNLRVLGAEGTSDTHEGVIEGIDSAMAKELPSNG